MSANSIKNKTTVVWALATIAIIGLILGLAKLGASAPAAPADAPGAITALISPADHAVGNPAAAVTLIEYSDFQCPACAAYYSVVEKLKEKYADRVLFVFRHYPLSQHQNALLAAEASEAAAKQNKFWEMHDLLFKTQNAWSDLSNPADFFTQLAGSLGLNKNQFLSDLDSAAVIQKITNDINSGTAGNIRATPSFYLNYQKLTNLSSYDILEKDLAAALSAAR